MTDDEEVMRPGGRVRRTICYGPPFVGRIMIDAAEKVLFDIASPHDEFPLTDDLRDAARASIAAACQMVQKHTERWGTPETMEPSTWSCVAWTHREHAEAVLTIVTAPTLNLRKLKKALNAWRKYGL